MGPAALVLPWPARELHPNARVHYHAKAKAAKAYREGAYWLARSRDLFMPSEGLILLTITICPPDKRRRDIDGVFSACKNSLDGIADALGCNDDRFIFNLRRGQPMKGGAVVVEIELPLIATVVAAQDIAEAA